MDEKIKARKGLITLKYLCLVLVLIIVLADVIFGWIVYNNIDSPLGASYQQAALVLAIVNVVVILAMVAIIIARIAQKKVASIWNGTLLMGTLMLLCVACDAMLWFIYARYTTIVSTGYLSMPAVGLVLFGGVAILILILYILSATKKPESP